jgi:hypothetical protein
MTGEVQSSTLDNQEIEYDASATLVTKATGFADFFTNTHKFKTDGTTTLCGAITACSLKTPSGCAGSYVGTNLAITSATGAITGKQNVDAGYVESVCISCENSVGSIVTYDNW